MAVRMRLVVHFCVDHVAVTLFLTGKYAGLSLHIPAGWNSISSKYNDDEAPGRVSNYHHRQFSEKIGRSSLEELEEARRKGAGFIPYNGFSSRNTAVASSLHLIAFTWSQGQVPRKGGTMDTWNKAVDATRKHVFLGTLVM